MTNLATDLTLTLTADRPGTLAAVLEAVAKARVNIEGYAEVEGILHLLVKDSAATRRALEGAGFQVREEKEVVLLDVQDKPGVAAGIFRRIADANVNVNFSYLATNNRIIVGAESAPKVADLFPKEKTKAARSR
jgi:hypothetical protein